MDFYSTVYVKDGGPINIDFTFPAPTKIFSYKLYGGYFLTLGVHRDTSAIPGSFKLQYSDGNSWIDIPNAGKQNLTYNDWGIYSDTTPGLSLASNYIETSFVNNNKPSEL